MGVAAAATAISWAAGARMEARAQVVLTPGPQASSVAGSGHDMAFHSSATALTAALASPAGMALDAAGNLLVADIRNHLVLRIVPSGATSIAAGNGTQGYSGDGGPATSAQLDSPNAVAFTADGTLLIADTRNHCIRRVDSTGIITTLAGNGLPGFSGDNVPGAPIQFRNPTGIAVSAAGDIYIADTGNRRIRVLNSAGSIRTVAGTGVQGIAGDGGPALSAQFDEPGALAFTSDGRLLIADGHTARVLATDGTLTSLAQPAGTPFRNVKGLAQDASGNILVSDAADQKVVALAPDGTSAVLGSGVQGRFAAGAPLQTALDTPAAVLAAPDGTLFLSDRRNHQVQKLVLPVLDFGSVTVGVPSGPQPITLTNTGTASAQVLAFSLPANFVVTAGSCPPMPFPLAAGASCSIQVLARPTVSGTARVLAILRVQGQAAQAMQLAATALPPGSTQPTTTTLQANGTVSYAGMPVTFTAAVSGTSSQTPSGQVTLYDNTTPLASASLSGGQAQISTSSLAVGQHSIRAAYAGGDGYAGSTSAALAETVQPQPDFTLAPTSAAASYTVKSGGSLAIPFTLQAAIGVLQQTVSMTVGQLPPGATASFQPSNVLLGASPQVVTLSVQLPPATSSLPGGALPFAACVLLVCSHRRRRMGAALALLAITTTFVSGCGGFRGATASTAGQSYTLIVTATAPGVTGVPLSHTCTITLNTTP